MRTGRGLLLACLWAVLPTFLRADAQTVWRIGNFDEASIEFEKQIEYSDPAQDPVFVVGKSDARRDWPAYQPGSANGQAGFRLHPFSIVFGLPEPPSGRYTLKVAVLSYTPRIPRLQINVNGHRGWFYQRPKLNYRMGDPAGNGPTYATNTIAAEVPAAFLRRGDNRIELVAIDEPGERDDSVAPPGRLGDSGITYDALELKRTAGKLESEMAAEIVPSIFYKSGAAGLSEVMEVYLRATLLPKNATVTLMSGSFKSSLPVSSQREFGEQKFEFEVPENEVHGTASVILQSDGKSRQFRTTVHPGKKWTVFVVPHQHLDIGYSDYQAKTYEVQSRALDQALAAMEEHPSFRYTLDGYWVAEQFLRTRSEPQRRKFLGMLRKGNIGVPANYFNLLTGFASSEEMIRSLYAGYKFHQQESTRFDYASITDVPSYSWSYASVLAAAGLKYLVAASNNERAPILRLGHLNAKSPFWWEGPDGGRIPMWYSQSYQQMPHIFGLPPKVAGGHDTLPIFLQHYSTPDYHSDGVIVYGSQWENTALYAGQFNLDRDWNRVYAFPHVRFAGFSEAMDYITSQAGDRMPVQRGDGGPYWEDGIASDAYYAALARQNQQRAISAELFSTIGASVSRHIQPDREALDSMWKSLLLFDEHCWEADRSIVDPTSDESVQQRAVKESRSTDGKRLIDELLGRSLSVIADSTGNPSDTLMVFNSLNWERSGLVETDLTQGMEIVDLTTGRPVPYEVLFTGNSFSRVRLWAENVPSVGYKSYALRRASSPAAETKVTDASNRTLENRYYRIVLDPASGSVESIFDKELNRELVDRRSEFHFNQYVYVKGADQEPNRLTRYSEVLPVPTMEPHAAKNGRVVSIVKTPFGTVAKLTSSGLHTPAIETEIILFDDKKEVLFTNRLRKEKVFTKEGAYFAFPFAVENPEFVYETQNGYVNPARDMLPGAGLEWFSVQHWAAVKNTELTVAVVPLDAPLVSFGDIVRGTFPNSFGSRKPIIFSYAMNNYWTTNYVAGQGGEFVFRYAMTSGRNLSAGTLSRIGRGAMTPFEMNIVFPQDRVEAQNGPLPATAGTFLQVENANVVLNAWKEAEDGKGTILRFTETNGESGSVNVVLPELEVSAAWRCNALEVCRDSLSASGHNLKFDIKPFQIVTLRVDANGPAHGNGN